jgi:signal transduction histidine kinase
MSHELRTPLNAVIGFSDMMINELFGPLSNEHYRQYTAHINRSAQHLLDLINSILDLSKVESGHYSIEKREFAVRELWESAFAILQARIEESGVKVSEDLSRSSLVLNGDLRVFRQILINLMSNAVKFTPSGGRVAVTAGTGGERRFTLRVADSGIGIAAEHLDLVLKPFQQVDNSLSRKYDGIGLGLPLTLKLVNQHGGDLRIDSRLGEGTTVTVSFPADIVVASNATCEEPATLGLAGESSDPRQAPPLRKRGANYTHLRAAGTRRRL